jgi:hypothetical protein
MSVDRLKTILQWRRHDIWTNVNLPSGNCPKSSARTRYVSVLFLHILNMPHLISIFNQKNLNTSIWRQCTPLYFCSNVICRFDVYQNVIASP